MEIQFSRKQDLLNREELVKFDIYINGDNTYYSESKQFALTYTSCLYTTNKNDTINLRLTVKKLLSLTPHYHIKLDNNETLTFNTVSLWGGHFQCIKNEIIFDIFYYRKGRCTVYVNDNQVAGIELPTMHSGKVYVDDSCEHYELIMAFILIMDWSTTRFKGRSIFANPLAEILYAGVGRIKPFSKNFNPDWHPK